MALSLIGAIGVTTRTPSPSLKNIRFTYFNKKKKEVGLIPGFTPKMRGDFGLLSQQALFVSDQANALNQGFGWSKDVRLVSCIKKKAKYFDFYCT